VTGERRHVLNRVSKRYSRNGPAVIDDVTFDISPGGHTLIVGSNGSGKSTLLSTMAGAAHPTSGVVCTPGPIGYVPERLPSHLRFTADEYVSHMGRIRGMPQTEVSRRSGELFDRFGLVPGPKAPFESLSKGNRQKVILAQAFLGKATTVILDEPASGLDRPATEVLAQVVCEARDAGTSIITSAQELAWWAEPDRILRISQGRLLPELPNDIAPSPAAKTLKLVAISPVDFDVTDVARFDRTQVVAIGAAGMVEIITNDRVVDALLSDLLSRGWSIRSLSPNESPDGESAQ